MFEHGPSAVSRQCSVIMRGVEPSVAIELDEEAIARLTREAARAGGTVVRTWALGSKQAVLCDHEGRRAVRRDVDEVARMALDGVRALRRLRR